MSATLDRATLEETIRYSVVTGIPKPAYLAEVGWGQGSGGLFTFGISQFGSSTDVLAADSWSAGFMGQYDNVSASGRSATIERGRDNDLTTMRAGSLELTLKDPTGLFNPASTSSPLATAGNLDTEKPVRISAILAGVTYPLYYGFITDIEADPSGRKGQCVITAVDFLDKLDRQSPVITPAAGMTDGQIVGLILDWFNWKDPAMRSLGAGDTISASYTRADGSRTGLALTAELLESERGIVFVNKAGAVTYRPRQSRYTSTSLGTIDRTLKGFPVGKTNANVINQWTVQRTDMAGNNVGVAQTAGDLPSQRAHGTISQTIATPFLNSDSQALSLAQYLLLRTRGTSTLVYEIPVSIADTATMIQVLSRDIGDRITLTIAPRNMPQITGDFYVESVRHEISTSGAPRHACTWRVSQVPSGGSFTFGVSKFGSTDYLTY